MARGTRSGAKRSPPEDAEDDVDGTTTTTRQTRSTRSSEQPEDSSKAPSPKKSKTEEDEKGKKEEDDVDASKASAAAASQPKNSPPSSPSNKKRPASSETEESENKRTRRGKKEKEADVAATKDANATDADDGDKAKPDSEKDAQPEPENTQNKEEDTKDTADKKDTANDANGDDDEKKAPPASVDEKAKEGTPAGDEQKPPGKEEKPPASVEEPKPPAKSKEDIEEEKHRQAQQKFNEVWPDMIKELIKFKEEFGHVEVPILGDCDLKYYELSKWVGKLRTQMKNYEERQHPTANKVQEIAGAASLLAGRTTAAAALAPPTTNSNPPPPKSLLDESKIKELTEIGFTFKYKRGLKRKTKEEEAEQFDKFCNLLEEFKEKGKSIKSHTQLQGWIAKQRKQYVEYQAIRQSTLTEERIERLTKAGMNWNPKQTQTWEQRALAWKEFKEKTGKDPKRYSEDGLGKWVTEQRSKYKRYQKGQSTNLTSDQIQTLKDWGFSFEGAIKQPENKAKPASWDERFKQLEEWKEEHGHCIVPQHFPILGQWVHGVRSQYRKFKEGKKCNMTQDKIDKLENIGFVFYTGKGGGARTPESVARRLENEKKAKEDGTSPKKSAKKGTSAKTDASSKTNIKEEESKGDEAKESKGDEAKESKGEEAKESKGEEKEPDKEEKEPDAEEDIVVEETVTV